MTDLQRFVNMLTSAGIDHGTRQDFDSEGMAVQVEHGDDNETVTDWCFDADGALVSTCVCTE